MVHLQGLLDPAAGLDGPGDDKPLIAERARRTGQPLATIVGVVADARQEGLDPEALADELGQ